MRLWKIYELLSSKELMDEGGQMKHCVWSYAQSCHRGECRIFSITVQTADGIEKMLTIEVRLASMSIRQVRGKLNRLPEPKEREIVQRWATKYGLTYE